MYTLDTNVILYYLRGDASVVSLVDQALAQSGALYVSSISVGELFIFSKLTVVEEAGIRKFLTLCSVISVDGLLADRAGTIGRTHKVELADSIIAATALFTGSTLLTRNTRDFRRVPSLSLQKI